MVQQIERQKQSIQVARRFFFPFPTSLLSFPPLKLFPPSFQSQISALQEDKMNVQESWLELQEEVEKRKLSTRFFLRFIRFDLIFLPFLRFSFPFLSHFPPFPFFSLTQFSNCSTAICQISGLQEEKNLLKTEFQRDLQKNRQSIAVALQQIGAYR